MTNAHPQTNLRAAFAEALLALRSGRAATAEAQLRAILAATPEDVNILRQLGATLLYQDKLSEAHDVLARAVRMAPHFWAARTDLARVLRARQRPQEAHELLREVLSSHPNEASWLALGDVLVDLEQYPEAKGAYEHARLADPHLGRIDAARAALGAKDRKAAESLFREVLKLDASHVGALCGLAAVSMAASRGNDALRLLRHAQKQSQHLPLIFRGYCQAFMDLGRLPEAEQAAQFLLKIEGENYKNWVTLGNVYTRLMRQSDALPAFEAASKLNPSEVRLRLSIGHLHKTLGDRGKAEQAYHDCIALDPAFSEAYSSLADLKNYVFDEAEVAAMQALDQGESGDDADQSQLHFALGRAHEHKKDYATAFRHYAIGNARRRKIVPFDIATFENKSRRVRAFFNGAFFERVGGAGLADPSPIFVVGLPRSGSTLIEQILASHSQVEGTFELPNVLTLVREFDHSTAEHDGYPEAMGHVPRDYFAALGQRYIDETAPLRSGKPHFIDKMPNNFSHVGLIHAILPRALIIDARRHPMDACFSTFKQYFAEGQSFSYDLEDLGRYYRSYLELMDHWDEVLPGRVLHVQYEELVKNPETEIKRLLAYCGLTFEPACLNFHESKRPVRTASSEQVRQPLYTSGVGYWRHFAEALVPLREALGNSLDRFVEY